MSVDRLIADVIAREGGYVDHPADRGGPTNFGITQAVARANGYAGPMRALPRATAEAIYRRLYWTNPGKDRIATLYPRLAAELFDTGVNMGPVVAMQMLQRVLNAMLAITPLVRDGVFGSVSMDALRQYHRARGAAGEAALVHLTDSLQGERYIGIVERRPTQRVFLYGWATHRLRQV